MSKDFSFLPGEEREMADGVTPGANVQESREALRAAVRDVLTTPAGLRVVNAILDRTGVYAPSLFTRDNGTFYLVGRRDVGAELQAMLMDAEPEALIRLSRFRREHEDTA